MRWPVGVSHAGAVGLAARTSADTPLMQFELNDCTVERAQRRPEKRRILREEHVDKIRAAPAC